MLNEQNVRDAERVLSNALGEDVQLQPVLDGVNKTLSGQSAKGGFFLRLSPESLHAQSHLRREADLLTLVAEREPSLIAKPFPDARHAGTAFSWNDNRYFGIATTIAEGKPYDDSVGELRRFGQALARLHAVPISADPDIDQEETARPSQSHTAVARLNDEISLVRSALEAWTDANRPVRSDRRSIRHGDAWPGNGRFSAEAVTLFDFEHISIGDPVADLASVAWWVTGLQNRSQSKAELWTGFLDGYSEGTTGKDLDLTSLPYHVLLVELRSLLFLRDFIALTPSVEESIRAGTRNLVDLWRDRGVPWDGRMSDGW